MSIKDTGCGPLVHSLSCGLPKVLSGVELSLTHMQTKSATHAKEEKKHPHSEQWLECDPVCSHALQY